MARLPIINNLRLVPRDADFLERKTGARGEIFYDQTNNTLKIYDSVITGGYTVLTDLNTQGVAAVEYTVTINNTGDGNKYILNGEYQPALNFVVGYTYTFNQNDSTNVYYPNPNGGTNNQHPLNFSSDNANGELGGGTVYTTNVLYLLDNKAVTKQQYWDDFENASQRSVSIKITSSTPTALYYWCQNHLNMGNTITVGDPGTGSGGTTTDVSDTVPESPESGSIWFDTTNARLYVYVNDGDSDQWIQPVSGTENIPTSLIDLGIADGTNGQVLTTDGAGAFSFTTISGGASDWSELTGTPTTLSGYGITDALGLAGGTMTGAIDAPTVANHKIRFLYDTLGDLPAASTYHGAVAHVHSEGKLYYAHAGAWAAVQNESSAVVDFADLGTTPTTLSGYGITDAQAALVSGTNIKTVNGQSIVGSGNLAVTAVTGAVTFDGTEIDSSDSSAISFVPAVVMNSDLTVENDLTVRQSLLVEGTFESQGSGTPEIFSDNEIQLNAGTRVQITNSPIQMASFTTAERDALLAQNGDVIYNTTTNKFQGYENGSWVNLI